ncbi:MAG: DPP IV N-terminal domain-containing protein [Salibacteraceae bacterium]
MNTNPFRSTVAFFIISFFLIPLTYLAQQKEFTLKSAVLERFSKYYPERPNQLQWLPKNALYSIIVDQAEGEKTLTIFDAEKSEIVDEMSLASLNKLCEKLDQKFEFFPKVQWISATEFMINKGNNYLLINREKSTAKHLFELPDDTEEITFNEDFSACAYVKDHNLYYLKSNGINIQVTADGKPGIVYGKAVHRSEFGIQSGMFWAPDNQKLAFYRMDETMVSDYPLVNISNQPASLNTIKYPMAGSESHHVQLNVFDPLKAKSITLKTGEPKEQYLTSVTWSPDSKSIYIALLNRDQNQMKLNRYNSATGSLEKTLFEEADEQYVEPENQLYFLPHDESKFIWQSERDGFNHLYLYNIEGTMLNPLTTGEWVVERIIGFDNTKNYLFVSGTGEVTQDRTGIDDERNATQRYTYLVDVEMGGKSILDDRIGTHSAYICENGKFIYEHFNSIETAWQTTLWEAIGKKSEMLMESVHPTKDITIGKAELLTLGFGDHELYARVIKPSNFDPNKKYPMLLYVYGGPHAQLVRNTFLGGAPLWMYWLAEQGVVVATVDNRGSDNRGIEFEQSTFRNLGSVELADQKDFVDYMIQTGYIDKNRLAIHGWSYGGFMTINMMLTYPGLFQSGVAGGPVCDWSMYEVMYTERYMDTPQANPEGFANANLIDRAKHLEDNLMIIHGTEDDVVLWQHSQAFLKACVDHEVQLDYFIYPGHAHNVLGKDRYHLMKKVLDYTLERIK